jgi:hypothetical protein
LGVERSLIAFEDRDGRTWGRIEGRLVTKGELDKYKYKESPSKLEGRLIGAPKQSPAPECSEDITQ